MPSLTYMLTFADVADLNKKWAVFGSDPAWKELSRQPGNTDPEIVSNISNLVSEPVGLFANLGRCRARMKRARQRPWPISKHPVAGPSRCRLRGYFRAV